MPRPDVQVVSLILALTTLIFCRSGPTVARPMPEHPAKKLFHEPSSPKERAWGEAAALIEQKKFKDAIDRLEGATTPNSPPGLDDHRAVLKARALAGLGRTQEALRLLQPGPAAKGCAGDWEDPIHAAKEELRADLLSPINPREAAEVLLGLPASGPRLARALELYRASKANEKAQYVERRLLLELPLTPEAKALAKQLQSDRVIARLGDVKARMQRVRHLLDGHENAQAEREALALLKEKDAGQYRCELTYIVGKARRKQRRYVTSVQALADAREICASEGPDKDFETRAGLLEVMVRVIQRDLSGAKRVAAWLEKTHAGHAYIDDAWFQIAELVGRSGDPKAAQAIYQKILDRYPTSDHAPDAAWRLAQQAIKRDEKPKAISLLETVVARKNGLSAIELARAEYWLGRLLEETAPDEAFAIYERTITRLTFYSWLTINHLSRVQPEWAKRLKERLIDPLEKTAPTPVVFPSSLLDNEAFATARAFASIGASDLAKAHLLRLDCRELSGPEVVPLALALDAVGGHAEAQRLLRTRAATLLNALEPGRLHVWYGAYSKPFYDLVQKAAEEEELEPLLLLALVREESTFDPEIVSWAGAVGLGQLMPATAVGAYASVYGGRLNMEDLTTPALNLRLGARVLAEALEQFGNREPLALGAYNAGHGSVLKWLGDRPVPFDEWVEDVSIPETRGYIKRVIETWGIYRLLYDAETPFITLPENIAKKPLAAR